MGQSPQAPGHVDAPSAGWRTAMRRADGRLDDGTGCQEEFVKEEIKHFQQFSDYLMPKNNNYSSNFFR
jgi:hypothetical protein